MKKAYNLAMFSFALLVNSTTIEEVIEHLKHMYTVFGSKTVDVNVQQSLQYINVKLQNMTNSDMDGQIKNIHETLDETVNIDDITESDAEEDEESSINNKSKAPFLPYIQKRLERSVSMCADEKLPVNEYYQQEFQKTLEDKWIGMLPFWSRIMYG